MTKPRKRLVARGPTGGNLTEAIEANLISIDEQLTDLEQKLLFGAAVVGNAAVLPNIGSYYVDLTKKSIKMLLPERPYVGERHTFKDKYGMAATNNLTLVSTARLIEQSVAGTWAASLVVNTNGASVTLEFDGDYWSQV
jgi:hypothetical protein